VELKRGLLVGVESISTIMIASRPFSRIAFCSAISAISKKLRIHVRILDLHGLSLDIYVRLADNS
jgi:hypothetical protein